MATSSFEGHKTYTYSACRTMASSSCTFLLSVAIFDPNRGRFNDDALGGSGVEPSVNSGIIRPTNTRSSD
jgi:hypothetical protein